MESDRFKKIEEDQVLTGIVRKQKEESRFDKLETGQEKEVRNADCGLRNEEDGKKYFPCPKCKRNNPDGSLYCIYCGYVFPEVAEATNGGLKPYEMKCPQCGRVGNRHQKMCVWCGYHFVPTDDDILAEGNRVEIDINGHKFASSDAYLPGYVKEALVKIKRDRLSPEGVEKVVNDIKIRQAGVKLNVSGEIDKSRYKIVGFAMLGAGGVFMFFFRIVLTIRAGFWAYLLGIVGGILIMAGLLTAAMGMTPGEIDEMRGYR
jgi:hypothetical protein